ncbi:MAG: phosphoribosylanthranilate isomerase [Pirellulales bacterium]
MFRIKLCGLTRLEDVPGVVAAGADAVGLNFYPPSKRYVDLDRAAELTAALPNEITRVGVFVNAEINAILAACAACRLNYVQLHGDESPETARKLQDALSGSARLIRALRLRDNPQVELEPYFAACQAVGVEFTALLIDAYQTGQYGGTGATADWSAVGRWTTRPAIPLILAGGLTPGNVAEAIANSRADGVDTAGGVESTPGRKDPALSREFVQAARNALDVMA